MYRLKQEYVGKVRFEILDAAHPQVAPLYLKMGAHHPVFLAINTQRGFAKQLQGYQDEAALVALAREVAR